MKTVKVKAYKKLSPTGKVENVDTHMRKLTIYQKQIQKQMVVSGKMEKIDTRHAHFEKVAKELGFDSAKSAFGSMGAAFISKAKIGAPSINK